MRTNRRMNHLELQDTTSSRFWFLGSSYKAIWGYWYESLFLSLNRDGASPIVTLPIRTINLQQSLTNKILVILNK